MPTKALVRIGGIPSTSRAIVRLKTPDADERGDDRDQPELGDRAPGVADRDGETLAGAAMAEPDAERKRDRDRGGERDDADPDMRPEQGEDVGDASDLDAARPDARAEDEVDGAPERGEHVGDWEAHADSTRPVPRIRLTNPRRPSAWGERQRDEPRLDQHQAEVEEHRHREQDHDRNEDSCLEQALLDREVERLSQPAASGEDREARDRDGRDGRDPNAGDDLRHRERQLDPAKELLVRHPHPPSRVLGRRRDIGEAGDDVAIDDLQRVEEERNDRGDVPTAGDRQQQQKERDRGDRVDHAR